MQKNAMDQEEVVVCQKGVCTPNTAFDRSRFERHCTWHALRVLNTDLAKVRSTKGIQQFLLKRPKTNGVLPDSQGEQNRLLVLLNIPAAEEVPAELKQVLSEIHSNFEVTIVDVATKYEDWTYKDALREIIPRPLETPTAFERIGHIAHVNLKEELLPYKHAIGQVILDKHPGLTLVVNKVSSLSHEFRAPDLEILAGQGSFEAVVKEGGAVFTIDYKNVYWNSRLSGERQVILGQVEAGSLVCDAMAGVGGFGVLLAKFKDCYILSNDLNPKAAACMRINARANKVAKKIAIYNIDARDFIRRCFELIECGTVDFSSLPRAEVAPERPNKKRKLPVNRESICAASGDELFPVNIVHFLLNLPSTAIDFLDAFNKLPPVNCQVWVHCYCFDAPDGAADVKRRVEQRLGYVPDNFSSRQVRNVAPSKRMYCAEFTLPAAAYITAAMSPGTSSSK